MRYSDFIKDPQWPQHVLENSFQIFNSDQENSPAYSPINMIHNDSISDRIKNQSSEESLSEFSEEEIVKKEEIFYSDEDCEDEMSENGQKIKKNEDDENWEEKPEKKKKIYRKKHTVKKQYERGRYNILDEMTKRKIVQESQQLTIVQVAKKYNVSVNNICRWRKRCDRRSGAGRKVTDTEMEERLLEWIKKQTGIISRKTIQNKARELGSQEDFKASKGWFERFYKRNQLNLNTNIEILTSTHYRRRMREEKRKEEIQETGVKSEEDEDEWEDQPKALNLFGMSLYSSKNRI